MLTRETPPDNLLYQHWWLFVIQTICNRNTDTTANTASLLYSNVVMPNQRNQQRRPIRGRVGLLSLARKTVGSIITRPPLICHAPLYTFQEENNSKISVRLLTSGSFIMDNQIPGTADLVVNATSCCTFKFWIS